MSAGKVGAEPTFSGCNPYPAEFDPPGWAYNLIAEPPGLGQPDRIIICKVGAGGGGMLLAHPLSSLRLAYPAGSERVDAIQQPSDLNRGPVTTTRGSGLVHTRVLRSNRGGSRKPTNRRRIDIVGPRKLGLAFAIS
jgi:hypothetical protein